jgi:phosphopantothenoylcysteine decarboxylase / phosphopantothenate---cysteine ligase
MLTGKRITMLITGCIAAYKMTEVASSLARLGADVTCVLTRAAMEFVSPLVLKTLSKNRVYTDENYFDAADPAESVIHIRLAQETDLILLAPATANSIAKYNLGIADDLVTSILLAADKPVAVFPAMNDVMYEKPVTQRNIEGIRSSGADVIKPDSGFLACGTKGIGRLPDPSIIVEYVKFKLYDKKDLSGMNVLINAGGTSEDIDKARCITNHSSGKMGISLAREAFYRGASVVIVLASDHEPFLPFVEVIREKTSDRMYKAMKERSSSADIIIFAAAVSDFIPADPKENKIKKSDQLTLELKKNIDIAAALGSEKRKNTIHIGFCAETGDLIERAKEKLSKKNLDYIFANDISGDEVGFGSDKNAGHLLSKNGEMIEFTIKSKDEIAVDFFDEILDLHKRSEK